jgi:hypothetical protein
MSSSWRPTHWLRGGSAGVVIGVGAWLGTVTVGGVVAEGAIVVPDGTDEWEGADGFPGNVEFEAVDPSEDRWEALLVAPFAASPMTVAMRATAAMPTTNGAIFRVALVGFPSAAGL